MLTRMLAAACTIAVITGLVFAALYFTHPAGSEKSPPAGPNAPAEAGDPREPGPAPMVDTLDPGALRLLREEVAGLRDRVAVLEAEMKKESAATRDAEPPLPVPKGAGADRPTRAETGTAEGDTDSSEPPALKNLFSSDESREAIRRIIRQEQARDVLKRKFSDRENFRKGMYKMAKEGGRQLKLTELQSAETREHLDAYIDNVFQAAQEAMESGDVTAFGKKRNAFEHELRNAVIDLLDAEQIEIIRKLDPKGFGQQLKERGM